MSNTPSYPFNTDHWLIVTVRIAWELVQRNTDFDQHVFYSAREHALRCIPSHYSEQAAGRYALVCLNDYLERCALRYSTLSFDEDIDIEIPLRWRKILEKRNSKSQRLMFRYFYAKNRSLASISKQKMVSSERLENAQIELRRNIRRLAQVDGLSTSGWSDMRLDRLLQRTAQLPNEEKIEPYMLLSSPSKQSVLSCPLYSQAYSLFQQGVLSLGDLEPQSSIEEEENELMVVVLHPEGRRFQSQIKKAMGTAAIMTTRDEWFIDAEFLHIIEHNLSILTELNTPPRHLLRGLTKMGSASWNEKVILGPLPIKILEEVRAQSWGTIEGVGELPPALPPPPNAKTWWTGVAAMVTVLILCIWGALSVVPSSLHYPITADSEYSDGHVYLRFDVHDQAHLTLFTFQNQELELKAQFSVVQKSKLSTGDGQYFIKEPTDRLVIMSSEQPIKNIMVLLDVAQVDQNPIETLISQVRLANPEVDTFVSSSPPPIPVADSEEYPNRDN